jgi:N-acetylneuraminic acid mutarotase
MRRLATFVLGCAACSSPATMDAGPSPWSTGPEMPGPRLEPGVTALGQRVVVLGGFDQSEQQGLRITRDVIVFDPFSEQWTSLGEAPVAWTHANLAGSSQTLYLLGGAEGTDFLARGEAYALDVDQPGAAWRPLAPMPPGLERSAAGVVVSPPLVYLVGGATTTDAVASVIAYNFSSDTWSTLPDLPEKRSHPAVMRTPDGTLIVAGGLSGLASSSARAEVWALPPGGTAWEARAPMPRARGGCAYGVVFEQLICAGGEAGTVALLDTDRYDPINNVWSSLDDLPDTRAGTQGAVVGGRLYVPGGARTLTFVPTNTLYVFAFLESLQK